MKRFSRVPQSALLLLPGLCLGLFAITMTAPPTAHAAASAFTVSANKHYWLKNGGPFIPIGHNRYDVWNSTDTANDGLSVTAYIQRMAQNGCNVIRVWAEQGDQNGTGDYWLEFPAGTYRASQQARLDELFTACDTYGVYVMICPWDVYNIKNNWAAHAYNVVNGGPCSTTTQVITLAACRTFIKNKIQYMYNRWGSHPSFFLWTFNEINQLDTSTTDQQNFVNDIGAFIHSIDPYHPFTVSWTGTGAGNPAVVQLSTDDAADIHFYGAISGTGGVAKENETATTRDGGYLNYMKPLVLSEWGLTHNGNTDDLVNALAWGGIGIGTSGAGMVWTDKYTFGSFTDSQRLILKNLNNFVATVDWPNFMDNHHASSSELSENGASITSYGSLNASKAIVLLVHSRVGNSTACTVTINGLNVGTYTIDIWSTYNGGQFGSLSGSTDGTGKLVVSAPAIATMQCWYVHQ